MILTEKVIKDIINKEPRKLRNKATGEEINEYTYSDIEMLELIQTFIYGKKGKDVGNIDKPKGLLCPSFANLCISKGINPMLVMSRSHDYEAMQVAFDVAFVYYKNKYNEIRN